jgi:hypothetical protein
MRSFLWPVVYRESVVLSWARRSCVIAVSAIAVSAIAGSACSFSVPATPCVGCGLDDAGTPDTLRSVDASQDVSVVAFCDPAGGDLIACFELEGNAQDGSPNNLDAISNGVAFVPGRSGLGAQVDGSSTIDIGENALLDPPAITMEAWIRPTQLPSGLDRAGIVDNNGQYGFFLHAAGALQCVGLKVEANVQLGVWTHVACTYDERTRIYVDGNEVDATGGGGGPLASVGTTGTSIAGDNPSGSRLIGVIDQIRIFKVARTAAQICAAAGTCP